MEENEKETISIKSDKAWYRISGDFPGFIERITPLGEIQIGTIEHGLFIIAKYAYHP